MCPDNIDVQSGTLSSEEAYAAMFFFLDGYWDRLKPEFLGELLSDMSLSKGGGPLDPAVTGDWGKAVKLALSGRRPPIAE